MNRTTFIPFLKYASLNVLGMLGISCYILADTFFVANGIGTEGLAALNLAIPVYSFVHGCALMLGMGGATKYTIAKSQDEDDRADLIFNHILLAAVAIAAVFMAVGLTLSRQIALMLGADAALFDMTNTYLKVILLFAPFFMLNEVLLAFVRSDGAPGLAMTAMVTGSLANIVLDYVFIYPFQMGIFGAVLATGISPIVSMPILSVHKLKGRNHFHLTCCPVSPEHILGSITLGFPSLVTEVSSGLVIIVFNRIVLGLAGNVGVAAYGIIANIALVTTAIYTGIAQGVQPLVSTAYGTGAKENIKAYLKYGIGAVVLLSTVVYAGIFCFAPEIAAAFNSENNGQLQSIAEYGMLLYFTSIVFTGFNVVIAVFFTSTETPMPAHVISLLRGLVVVIPMAYGLSAVWGLTGVWLAIPITEAVVALLAAVLWNRQVHKNKPR